MLLIKASKSEAHKVCISFYLTPSSGKLIKNVYALVDISKAIVDFEHRKNLCKINFW